MYILVLLSVGAVGAAFLMWWRSPMEVVNAEMAERVVTTRAALEEVAPRRPLLPPRRPRGPG